MPRGEWNSEVNREQYDGDVEEEEQLSLSESGGGIFGLLW